jgi:hypothetical protein
MRAIKRSTQSAGVNELREQELDRLDRLQRNVWAQALNGDLQAVQVALRIIDRRAKLLGLDTPVRQEILIEQIDNSTVDREIQRLVEMLNDTGSTDSGITGSVGTTTSQT